MTSKNTNNTRTLARKSYGKTCILLYFIQGTPLVFSILGLIFGLLAGTMSSVLTTAKVSEQLYKSRMNELNEFLRFKKCPSMLNTRGVSSFNDSKHTNNTRILAR